ncbi:hypothetical protein EYF80_059045 [Liparis tanakae]|uniref:Uncharacterized protein n=1 Tax=Liparis tanakae TaxID=230148 RepID=A0A4Z2ER12_9TELE|nr:hypothetical protein EYF80_059045 [Liparis tanakae]
MSPGWKTSRIVYSQRLCRNETHSERLSLLPAVSPHRVEVEHGRLQLRQLDGGDADGPDVTQVVVAAFLLYGGHLGSHPAQQGYERRRGSSAHESRVSRQAAHTRTWRVSLHTYAICFSFNGPVTEERVNHQRAAERVYRYMSTGTCRYMSRGTCL